MNSKVLVTGAVGNVGRYVTEELLEKKIDICIGDYDQQQVLSLFGSHVDFRYLDFYDPTTYRSVLDGVKKIFLVRPPAIANVKDSINKFLEVAKEMRVERVVFLSLYGVNPMTPHYWIERKIRKLDISYTFIRASFFMQNLSTTHREMIQKEDLIYIPAGNGKTSFVDVRDIAHAIVTTLVEDTHLNTKYTITGSQALNYYEVSKIMTEVLEREITYISPRRKNFRQKMVEYGHSKEFAKVVSRIYLMVWLRTASKITDDFKELTGQDPILLREFVEDFKHLFQPIPDVNKIAT